MSQHLLHRVSTIGLCDMTEISFWSDHFKSRCISQSSTFWEWIFYIKWHHMERSVSYYILFKSVMVCICKVQYFLLLFWITLFCVTFTVLMFVCVAFMQNSCLHSASSKWWKILPYSEIYEIEVNDSTHCIHIIWNYRCFPIITWYIL